MSFAFKRFNFFQPNQAHRHAFPPNACCVVPGGPLLWVGTESGAVCILDSRLSLRGTFNAHGHKVLEVLWLEVSSSMPECQARRIAARASCGPVAHGGTCPNTLLYMKYCRGRLTFYDTYRPSSTAKLR